MSRAVIWSAFEIDIATSPFWANQTSRLWAFASIAWCLLTYPQPHSRQFTIFDYCRWFGKSALASCLGHKFTSDKTKNRYSREPIHGECARRLRASFCGGIENQR